jgi:hypothetical protein
MKKRNGFVSNSSSSSFICEVCGEEQSGMDMCLSDADMAECENGHIVCCDHMRDQVDNLSVETLRSIYVSFENHEDDEAVSDADLKEIVKDRLFDGDDGDYNVKSAVCPVCQFSVLTDVDYISYIEMTKGTVRNDILQEIQSKFKSYNEFCDAVNESKTK